MNKEAIDQIIKNNTYSDVASKTKLIETHISWVILTKNFAFKIKKPIQYSFLSFSTLEKRKFYCEKEVRLNNRLAKAIYLGVVPIRLYNGKWIIEGEEGEIVDYAVKMKRLDNERRMDVLLQKGKVTIKHMEQLADQLADFHVVTGSVEKDANVHGMWIDFADILIVKDFLSKELGKQVGNKVEEAVEFSKQFLKKHQNRFEERQKMGFTIDGHGDLHSRNIFLLDEPVIFDCIEFNDHFRQVDVLNEIAFFCMDLDFYKRRELKLYFLDKYFVKHPCVFTDEDQLIFEYYKLYRANIRTKVNALKAIQTKDEKERSYRLKLVEDYYFLMREYLTALQEKTHVVTKE